VMEGDNAKSLYPMKLKELVQKCVEAIEIWIVQNVYPMEKSSKGISNPYKPGGNQMANNSIMQRNKKNHASPKSKYRCKV
jgi:hypothetical protein